MKKLTEWIDLLEGELSEVEAAELEMLLRYSVNDRRAFLNISRLKKCIKSIDALENQKELIDSPAYNKQLTKKIMTGIKELSSPESSKPNNVLMLSKAFPLLKETGST